jgi:riboflavin biosynthesis pyrimidine reductase
MSDPPIVFRRLLPVPGAAGLDVDALLDEMFHAIAAPGERPRTIVNFVASADGRVTVKGRSGELGDEGDRALFHGLRQRVDAVMAGPNTIRIERYGRILGKAERRRRRLAAGMVAEPLACLLTRNGNVPIEAPLFAEPDARVVVFGPAAIKPELDACPAQVELVALDPSEMTFTAALRRLRSDYGVRTLLCEGGPMVFGALLGEGLVDELFLTLAPKLVGGGTGPSITHGPELPEPASLRLQWLLEREHSLFARYAVN